MIAPSEFGTHEREKRVAAAAAAVGETSARVPDGIFTHVELLCSATKSNLRGPMQMSVSVRAPRAEHLMGPPKQDTASPAASGGNLCQVSFLITTPQPSATGLRGGEINCFDR